MYICKNNAGLLRNELPWIDELMRIHAGRQDSNGDSALSLVLRSRELDFNSRQLNYLINEEASL